MLFLFVDHPNVKGMLNIVNSGNFFSEKSFLSLFFTTFASSISIDNHKMSEIIDNNDETSEMLKQVSFLFLKYGLKNVTMDDIARDLGISKKTLYVHFPDKNTLIEKCAFQYVTKLNDKVNCAFDEEEFNAIEQAYNVFVAIASYINNVQPVVFYDLQKYYPKLCKIYNSVKVNVMPKLLKANLQKGKKEGLYRSDIDEDIIVTLYSKITDMIFQDNTFTHIDFTTLYREFFKYHTYGIASEKGRKFLESKFNEN